jgi:Acyl-CoA dehydrogenase, C-terminal domain
MLTLTGTIATIAKMNNTRKARKVIAEARDLLGGNGILLDFHVVRHLAGIDAAHTYEGAGTSLVPAPLPDGRTIRVVDIHADRVRLRTAVHDPAGRCC